MAWRAHRQQGRYPRDLIQVRFSGKDCNLCELKPLCTRSEKQGRMLHFQPQAEFKALKHPREYMATKAGQQAYRIRARVEDTIAQAAKAFGGRRSRYRGKAKTHFQQGMISSAITMVGVDNFLQGKTKGKAHRS